MKLEIKVQKVFNEFVNSTLGLGTCDSSKTAAELFFRI